MVQTEAKILFAGSKYNVESVDKAKPEPVCTLTNGRKWFPVAVLSAKTCINCAVVAVPETLPVRFPDTLPVRFPDTLPVRFPDTFPVTEPETFPVIFPV